MFRAEVLRAGGEQVVAVDGIERKVFIAVKKTAFGVRVPLTASGVHVAPPLTSAKNAVPQKQRNSSVESQLKLLCQDLQVQLTYAPLDTVTQEQLLNLDSVSSRIVHTARSEPIEYEVKEICLAQCCVVLDVKLNILSTLHGSTCFAVFVTFKGQQERQVCAITDPLSVVSRPERVKQPVMKQRRQSADARPATREEKEDRLRLSAASLEGKLGEHNLLLNELLLRHEQMLQILKRASPLMLDSGAMGTHADFLSASEGHSSPLLKLEHSDESVAFGAGMPRTQQLLQPLQNQQHDFQHQQQQQEEEVEDGEHSRLSKKRKHMEDAPSPLEIAFDDFVAAFGAVPAPSRPTQVRKAVRGVDAEMQQRAKRQQDLGEDAVGSANPTPELEDAFGIGELLRTYLAATNELHETQRQQQLQSAGTEGGRSLECTCEDCPHQAELNRIDQFYSDALGLSAIGMSADLHSNV